MGPLQLYNFPFCDSLFGMKIQLRAYIQMDQIDGKGECLYFIDYENHGKPPPSEILIRIRMSGLRN